MGKPTGTGRALGGACGDPDPRPPRNPGGPSSEQHCHAAAKARLEDCGGRSALSHKRPVPAHVVRLHWTRSVLSEQGGDSVLNEEGRGQCRWARGLRPPGLPEVPTRRTCWLWRLRRCPLSLLTAGGQTVSPWSHRPVTPGRDMIGRVVLRGTVQPQGLRGARHLKCSERMNPSIPGPTALRGAASTPRRTPASCRKQLQHEDPETTAVRISENRAGEAALRGRGPRGPGRSNRSRALNPLSTCSERVFKSRGGGAGGRITQRGCKTLLLPREAPRATEKPPSREETKMCFIQSTKQSSLLGLIKNISYKNIKH